MALLLQRGVIGLALLIQGVFYLREANPTPATWMLGMAAVAVAALLLVGLFTSITGIVAGLGGVAIGLSLLPASTSTLFDSRTPVVLAATMLLVIVVFGPGAFSVDARVFGRREIMIPPPISRHE